MVRPNIGCFQSAVGIFSIDGNITVGHISYMSTLSTYLKAQSVTQANFAELVGVSQGYIAKLCAGSKQPSLEVAKRVEKATDGDVKVSSWPEFSAVMVAISGDAA